MAVLYNYSKSYGKRAKAVLVKWSYTVGTGNVCNITQNIWGHLSKSIVNLWLILVISVDSMRKLTYNCLNPPDLVKIQSHSHCSSR